MTDLTSAEILQAMDRALKKTAQKFAKPNLQASDKSPRAKTVAQPRAGDARVTTRVG